MRGRLLTLTGIVIPLAVLGIGMLGHGMVWLVFGLMSAAWNLWSVLWSAPTGSGFAQFWPLMLVASGLAIWWSTKRDGARVRSSRQKGDGNGQRTAK
jgi:hypothetical protein